VIVGGALLDPCDFLVEILLAAFQQRPGAIAVGAAGIGDPCVQRTTFVRVSAFTVSPCKQPLAGILKHPSVNVAHLGHVGELKQSEGTETLMSGVFSKPLVPFVLALKAF